MSRHLLTLLPVFLLISCAEVHSLDPSPTKRPRYEIEYNGVAINMDVCYKKAASLCPNGYKELNRDVGNHGPYTPSLASPLGMAMSSALPSGVKGINIECK